MSTDLKIREKVLCRIGAALGVFPEPPAMQPDGRTPALRLVAVIVVRQRIPYTNHTQTMHKLS
jgi:hypothetical protein